MLLVNGKKLTELKPDDPFMIHYHTAIKLLKEKFGNSVQVDFPKDKYKVVGNPNDTSARIETPGGVVFRNQAMYDTPVGIFEIIYYTSSRARARTQQIEYLPQYTDFSGRTVISLSTNPDFAFFMFFVYGGCGKISGDIGNYQNLSRKKTKYILLDEDAEIEAEMKESELISEAGALIASPRLGLSDEAILKIGLAYGLINPNLNNSPFVNRRLVKNHVMNKDRRGKYDKDRIKKFLDDANLPRLIEVQAISKQLISLGKIGLRVNAGKRYWVAYAEDGSVVKEICGVNSFVQSEKSLEDFLINSPQVFDELSKLLDGNSGKKEDDEDDEILGSPYIDGGVDSIGDSFLDSTESFTEGTEVDIKSPTLTKKNNTKPATKKTRNTLVRKAKGKVKE